MPKPTKSEHPHIVVVPGVCGGRPVIDGTRISVDFVAELHQLGEEASDIAATYPHLSLAAVHDALSYYYDHQQEIDQYLADNTLEKLKDRYGFDMGERGLVIFRGRSYSS